MNPLTNVKNLTKLNERELELGVAGSHVSWHAKYKDSAWIFVGGLPYDLTEGDILCVFSQYGEIVNINLVREKQTGKSKGYCFICYQDQRSTILAVDNFNGIKMLGRTLRVDHVEEYRQPKEDEDLDDITKRLREEGCAPKLVEKVDVPSEKKKGKKKKKKKSKDNDKTASNSEADEKVHTKHSTEEKKYSKKEKVKETNEHNDNYRKASRYGNDTSEEKQNTGKYRHEQREEYGDTRREAKERENKRYRNDLCYDSRDNRNRHRDMRDRHTDSRYSPSRERFSSSFRTDRDKSYRTRSRSRDR